MRSELSVEDIKWALLVVGISLILWGFMILTTPNSIPIHGFVRHMNSSTRTKMRNHMLSLGIPADKADTLLVDYYIQCAYFQAWKTVLIIGILMVVAGTWMILSQYVFTFRIRR